MTEQPVQDEPNGSPPPTSTDGAADRATPTVEDVEDDDLDTLKAELAEMTQKAEEYLRLAQRTQADFINYRRRTDDERAQQIRDANLAYIQRLLPVLDDFERALANAAPEDLESNWGKGLLLVERNLRNVLASDDVQRIAAENAVFDPREHEAVGSQPSADVAEGHVLHVTRQGYRRGERVIRPAQVIVSAGPQGS